MQFRAVLTVLAVALLAASGCTTPPEGETTTVTPAPVPADDPSRSVGVETATPTTTECLWVRDGNRTGNIWVCAEPQELEPVTTTAGLAPGSPSPGPGWVPDSPPPGPWMGP
jgi:hypothetical protein